MKEEKLIIHPKRPKGDDGYKTFSIRFLFVSKRILYSALMKYQLKQGAVEMN